MPARSGHSDNREAAIRKCDGLPGGTGKGQGEPFLAIFPEISGETLHPLQPLIDLLGLILLGLGAGNYWKWWGKAVRTSLSYYQPGFL